MTNNLDTELDRTNPDYDRLVAFLRDRFEDELRWVASFNTDTYGYKVRYIRPDLKTELSSHDLDVIIHRTIALLKRPYVEEVYTHLGHVQSLVLQHERATAVHVYLGDAEGFVVKIRAGNGITVPGFIDDCLTALYGPRS